MPNGFLRPRTARFSANRLRLAVRHLMAWGSRRIEAAGATGLFSSSTSRWSSASSFFNMARRLRRPSSDEGGFVGSSLGLLCRPRSGSTGDCVAVIRQAQHPGPGLLGHLDGAIGRVVVEHVDLGIGQFQSENRR